MNWLQSFFGSEASGAVQNPSPIDVVVFLASLASKPEAIDPLLENVRRISSMQAPGAELSEQDQIALAEDFKKLEQYLIQNEPVRAFSKEELAKKIGNQFTRSGGTNAVFWNNIGV